jgi:hypothetical protein
MLIFLAANLGYVKTPLAQAMADEVSIRRPTGAPDMEIAYAWHVQTKDGNSIIWHNGGTGGYRTYMGYDPKARTGVLVLSNISTPEGTDDIGRHLLNASYPLLKVNPPTEHKQITLDPTIFDRYVATYQLRPNALLTVARDGERFYTQLTGQPRFEIFAESERKFFLRVIDAQLTFDFDQLDQRGPAARVTLHQNGADIVAKRVSQAEVNRALDEIEARKAETAKRIKDQTPMPDTEAVVHTAMEQLRSGTLQYDRMSPALAAATRQQLPQIQAMLVRLGSLQSVSFKGVAPNGFDIYQVKFENGSLEYRILLGPDGKVEGANLRPAN